MHRAVRAALFAAALGLGACAVSRHPTAPVVLPAPAPDLGSWDAILARPGILELDSVVAANWEVKLKGLVNLERPEAEEAGLHDAPTPIVLPLHLLKHPTRGVWIVDSGIDADMAAGGSGPARGLLKAFLGSMEPVESLASALARQGAPVAGALITHAHLDHILGLPDLPPETPIYMGPGELEARGRGNALGRRTVNATLRGKGPIQIWDFDHGAALAPFQSAVDILGDGSLWALYTPGHTPGSTSYLALTTAGPVLFTGDTSHTYWGFEHGVEPGGFTMDHDANLQSLGWLRGLKEAHPEIRVFVGHELSGEGTGVAAAMGWAAPTSPEAPAPAPAGAPAP